MIIVLLVRAMWSIELLYLEAIVVLYAVYLKKKWNKGYFFFDKESAYAMVHMLVPTVPTINQHHLSI